ncbi:hypothetical protein HMPREF9535_03357 [Escherichia coli MS 78-1]|nr:hypothetical protein HMPREF9540_02567 [Escherichia coli MS 115-1]EFK45875.1 hypothetical protein HMPREF9346_02452 [Escherichia coli MS 119-7]EFK49365.1 hypothetical protein HMPREF9345_04249 [Escherichia coli MS 107-1]EFK72790.1 hypothetical protein HMPREF9535_03357 [Escherichia coli MS 78-1]EGB89846.1 hypothetical protein HMPREF9542_00655 [Escherichia coli MS 117-3]EGU97665.1 hypothetical protein HMPREF9349_02355 [Escherichia coli MS 79-10]ESA77915.1 hypothetical protein HMPREF1592_02634 [
MAYTSSAKTPFQRATALSGLLRSRECTALSCCTRTCWCCVDFVTQRPQHAFARKEIGCFTYNPWAIMKVSYNRVFLPEGLPIVCYNRASFLRWIAFLYGFRN